VAAAESLYRGAQLYILAAGIHHSDRVGGFSGVGIAKRTLRSRGVPVTHGISYRSFRSLPWAYDVRPRIRAPTPDHTGAAILLMLLRSRPRVMHFPPLERLLRSSWPPAGCPFFPARKIDSPIGRPSFQSLSDVKGERCLLR